MLDLPRKALTLALLIVVLPELARACSCSGPGPLPCHLFLKEASAIFLGTVTDIENPPSPDSKVGDSGLSRYTFAVMEAFAGVSTGEAIVYSGRGGADCSYHFKGGEQYLVYAYRAQDNSLQASVCSRTQPAAGAEVLLRQLRAAKTGKQVASVYGVLRRTQQPYNATFVEDYDRPITNTTVSLRSKTGKVFAAKTGDFGDYAFYNLPQGVYEVSADLPRNLSVAQTILSEPPAPITLPALSCLEYDIDAMPQAQITGHLVGPDGKFLEGAVELFAGDIYEQQKEKRGWWEYAEGEKGFLFDHLAPGNYILVFNSSDRVDPDAPYPRTFYPGVTDLSRAARIHITENDRQVNGDIHLSGGEETTQVTVRLEWTGSYKGKKDDLFLLSVHSDSADRPFPRNSGDHLFSVRLLKRATYTLQGTCYCHSNQRAETNSITISGSDVLIAPVVLHFPESACAK